MAYVFGFPSDVTDAIMDMRDWRWEMVRDGGKTPSASCFDVYQNSGNPQQKPALGTLNFPRYQVETYPGVGEVVCVNDVDAYYYEYDYPGHVGIFVFTDNGSRFIELQSGGGVAPAAFQRLQDQNAHRIKELW